MIPSDICRRSLFFLVIFAVSCSKYQEESIFITVSGDLMPDRGIRKQASITGISDFFSEIAPLYQTQDASIINMEGVLSSRVLEPENKTYTFIGDPEWAKAAYNAGVTHAGIANNHSMDYGAIGVRETQRYLQEAGVIPIGGSCNPVLLQKGNTTVRVFSYTDVGGSTGVLCDREEILLQGIQSYRQQYPKEVIVVIVHWGMEYTHRPTSRQSMLARQLIDHQVDIVIGHHPHVVQQISYYKGKPIIYSLGNLIFDQVRPGTNTGGILQMEIQDNHLCQLAFYPIRLHKGKPSFVSKEEISRLAKNSWFEKVALSPIPNGWLLQEKKKATDVWEVRIDDAHFQGRIRVSRMKTREAYRLSVIDTTGKEIDKKRLDYPVYTLQKGDINGDGKTDIVLGIVKATKYHPEKAKRLFTFSLDQGKIRPLWLGSQLSYELKDVKLVEEEGKVYVYSLEFYHTFMVGKYYWKNFGVTLDRFVLKGADETTATQFFNAL
ncbi:CapA family protein [Aquimarina hainanensis]|uniref:CapA family protein n=1 Tax=Aquimarina hainanensis TaxID=1578017 RepID=A0ABW5ND16_9FLAO